MTITRIPAEAVVILRSALLSELGVAASRIEEASMTHAKEKHPELFLRPLALLDDYRRCSTCSGGESLTPKRHCRSTLTPIAR
ncbi:MAG TPA: hypothetical protein VK691_10660 [Solirubrobacteraceae bacterium]|jgi:hypothetical protein|nr:hypothetical protein [Solirubrobacteraceae bacterium]